MHGCVHGAFSARLPAGVLCQSPVVWPSRTVLHFPCAGYQNVLWHLPLCCYLHGHRGVPRVQLCSQEGGGQCSTPCTQDKYPCR